MSEQDWQPYPCKLYKLAGSFQDGVNRGCLRFYDMLEKHEYTRDELPIGAMWIDYNRQCIQVKLIGFNVGSKAYGRGLEVRIWKGTPPKITAILPDEIRKKTKLEFGVLWLPKQGVMV